MKNTAADVLIDTIAEWGVDVIFGMQGEPNRTRSPSRDSRIKFVNSSKVATSSVASMWVVPLGQTPDYLDPQSQEALHEVDVSGMVVRVSFDQPQRGRYRELDRWMTEQGASYDTD